MSPREPFSIVQRGDQACREIDGVELTTASYVTDVTEQFAFDRALLEDLQSHVVNTASDFHRDESRLPTELIEFTDNAAEYVFDQVSDRTVLVHGFSRTTAQHPGRRLSPRVPGFDKGHAKTHAPGGLEGGPHYFHQLPDVNRRLSPRGKLWRDIEDHLAKNPGRFRFTHLIYPPGSDTQTPIAVEYGFTTEKRFPAVTFPN